MCANRMVVHVVGPVDPFGIRVTIYEPAGHVLEFWYRYPDETPRLRYRFTVSPGLLELRDATEVLRSFYMYLEKLPVPPQGPGELFLCVARWLRCARVTLHISPDNNTPLQCHGEVPVSRIARLLPLWSSAGPLMISRSPSAR